MDEKRRKLAIWIVASLIFQGSIYLYFDQILLAPTSAYEVSAATDTVAGGKAYYSRDRRYTAIVKDNSVDIYMAARKEPVRTVELSNNKEVSFFRWLKDRDLALMAVHEETGATSSVTLTQIHPLGAEHELAETVSKLPRGSKIVDVAFSTATNVIYMQVQVSTNPEQYRVYRTDANRDLKRVYLNASKIGRIAVLYDRDTLFYDNIAEGTVTARHGDGSWEVVSPPVGKYRLVGVENNVIYLARLNAQGLATAIYTGRLKGKFAEERVLATPMDVRQITVQELGKAAGK
ncbi:hypothetical protein [Anaeroselena agilis]|uniref:Uncharacterized protein n=1 Tax=Anaeroselena agilis TaxID=3063788 RepID=A0ABU3NX61_9FIRM|nr:hypothetical protein [Selenomonadales bacterium 4137-cl]